MKHYLILVFFLSILPFYNYSQKFTTPVSLLINGQKAENVKYYFIKEKKAYSLKQEANIIILPDTISQNFNLLARYKKHQIVIPIIRYNEVSSIEVFFDNRLFNNIIHKEYGRSIFKYLLKKDYLIDLGFDNVFTTFKPKTKYELVEQD